MVMDKHDTVGIDCVAMCVNDVVCHGAKPLFFFGLSGCGQAGSGAGGDDCTRRGRRMPAGGLCARRRRDGGDAGLFYDADEYDLAGFTVGLVDGEKVIDGKKIARRRAGGPRLFRRHSNGFSLIRKILPSPKRRWANTCRSWA